MTNIIPFPRKFKLSLVGIPSVDAATKERLELAARVPQNRDWPIIDQIETDPGAIPTWTREDEAALNRELAVLFGWKE